MCATQRSLEMFGEYLLTKWIQQIIIVSLRCYSMNDFGIFDCFGNFTEVFDHRHSKVDKNSAVFFKRKLIMCHTKNVKLCWFSKWPMSHQFWWHLLLGKPDFLITYCRTWKTGWKRKQNSFYSCSNWGCCDPPWWSAYALADNLRAVTVWPNAVGVLPHSHGWTCTKMPLITANSNSNNWELSYHRITKIWC